MKRLALTLLALLSLNCQSLDKKKPLHQKIPLKIVSFKKEYKEFWEVAREKSFDEQLDLWNKIIEPAYPKFYDQVIHNKENSKNWNDRKRKSAKKLFKKLPEIHHLVLEEFNNFEPRIREQISKFTKLFPDANFTSFKIIAAPTLLRFNGQTNSIDTKPILAFGMDFLALLKREPLFISEMNYAHNTESFYGHELFHLYGEPRVGITSKEVAMNEAKLVIALWNEGIATYVSSLLNPNATLAEQFMDYTLARECPTQLKKLKREFKKDMKKPLYDPKDRSSYIKWFLLSSKDKSIPIRAGYCLGYFVVKDLAKVYTVHEMANWDFRVAQNKLFNYFEDFKK